MNIQDWENEGGSTWEDEDFIFEEEEFCPRCGEPFVNPGSPCVYCEFDPLMD